MKEAAQYYVHLLKKNPKSIALFPKNDEANEFNNVVTEIMVEDSKEILIFKAENSRVNRCDYYF